ncbi:hypothetical protein COOONC_14256 [Cooperia oncophora]
MGSSQSQGTTGDNSGGTTGTTPPYPPSQKRKASEEKVRPSGDKESVLSSTPSEKAPKPKKEPIFTPTEPSEPEGLGRMPKSKPVVQRKEKEG